MKTGETVTDLGVYASECCGDILTLDTGDVFPGCPGCSGLCWWELDEEVVPMDEIARLGEAA
jgi:hypothetical protein